MTLGETQRRAAEIARLNDQFRHTFDGGTVVITRGIQALAPGQQRGIIAAVRLFAAFTPKNDPHGEHDCVAMKAASAQIIWKIDYYDRALEYASPDPTDAAVTTRVLTIMLASEY